MALEQRFDGATYQARLDALAREGRDLCGEADLVSSFSPRSVLDAGCGTGRVAIELARRQVGEVVGVDREPSMLAQARRLAPELCWMEADLAELDLGRSFDVVLLAGNVPLFCEEDRRDALVRACASHVGPQGRLVAGFELSQGYELSSYDRSAATAGLVLEHRSATWEGEPFAGESRYAVSIHRRPAPPGR